ncbi:MAG: sigma 54-interacting transcriptional regulator, partial [Myxococcales bacterium]|nr:sigma 54-interacting transcriptional regulator [Myxococcales bacterium]
LLESELFGYAPGAFTGADPRGRAGQLAAADGGTLLLDELAEMSPALQAMLLRFLEDGVYRRVGETQARRADVRLICATCRDLPDMVARGEFRQDLYYRIRGAVLTLPPLRARTDLDELTDALLRQRTAEPPPLTPEARARIRDHAWPGNVRELKTALHYALVMAAGEPAIEPHHLPQETYSCAPAPARAEPDSATLEQVERDALRRALRAGDGNLAKAARVLGVARSTIYRMARRLGVDPRRRETWGD